MPLRQVSSLAPVAQVVVYALMPSGEAVADSQDFPVQLCLNNKVQLQPEEPPEVLLAELTLLSLQVSLKFSSLQALPAEKTTLTLKAHPGSLCSVRALDQSVLLLKAEEELTVNAVRFSALALRPIGDLLLSVAVFRSGLPAAALPEAVRVHVRGGGLRAVSLPPSAGGPSPQALQRSGHFGAEGRCLRHL